MPSTGRVLLQMSIRNMSQERHAHGLRLTEGLPSQDGPCIRHRRPCLCFHPYKPRAEDQRVEVRDGEERDEGAESRASPATAFGLLWALRAHLHHVGWAPRRQVRASELRFRILHRHMGSRFRDCAPPSLSPPTFISLTPHSRIDTTLTFSSLISRAFP